MSPDELTFLGKEVFSDSIVEIFSVDTPLASAFDGSIVEVGFKPGVTDTVGGTWVQAIRDAIKKDVNGVYTSRQYLFYGVSTEIAEHIAKDLIANGLIERWQVLEGSTYEGFPAFAPKVILTSHAQIDTIDLNVSDEELLQISHDRVLALTLEEMQAIRDYFISA